MSRPLLRAIAAGTTAVAVSACALLGSGYPSGVDPQIRPDGTSAPTVELDPADLPAPLADRQVVDLGWDAVPQESSGVFVGLGQMTEEALRFSAVTSEGTILWTTERPLSCTGFALTASDGRQLAVLTDLSPGRTTISVTTASAYDLHTGEVVWGPVEVPGPHAGPGLVFAEALTGGAMGSGGPRVALDATTGAVAATEEDLDGVRLVGEYHGTILIASDDHLVATDAHNNHEQWRLPLADLGLDQATQVAASPDATPGPGLAFVGDRDAGHALVDLADGTIIASAALDTATDPSTDVHVTVDHDRLHGHDPVGEPIWSRPVEPGTRIANAGNGVVYLVTAGNIHTRETATGKPLGVYDTPGPDGAVLPQHGDQTGAAVLDTADGLLLATTNLT